MSQSQPQCAPTLWLKLHSAVSPGLDNAAVVQHQIACRLAIVTTAHCKTVCCMQIWERAKLAAPASGEGLTRAQFSVALRLIAYAQVKKQAGLLHEGSLFQRQRPVSETALSALAA